MKVSCIMPTAGRLEMARRAIAHFLAQDFVDSELVILDSEPEPGRPYLSPRLPLSWKVPAAIDNPRVRYYPYRGQEARPSLGRLRNLCVDLASGELLAHWDDDDYSAPRRLADEVWALGGGPGFEWSGRPAEAPDAVGYHAMLFVDQSAGPGLGKVWKYDGGSGTALGTSLMYRRDYWRLHPFPDKTIGEDSDFLLEANVLTRSAVLPDLVMVARIHDRRTAPKPLERADVWTEVTDPGICARARELLA